MNTYNFSVVFMMLELKSFKKYAVAVSW